MISCIAIDDEPLALKQIETYIEKTPYLNLNKGFTSAIKALDYLRENAVDLMFIDIHMPDITGTDFVKSLESPPKVIFTTAYSEYAVEGFQLDAADYLVKPISYAAFLKSVEKTRNRYFSKVIHEPPVENDNQFLFIKSEHKLIRIDFNDIKYVEGMRDYVRIHLENQNAVMTLTGMKKIMQHLPASKFMQVHRSYIVNLTKISTVERNRIIFDKKVYIPVSDQYKEAFHNFLENNFLK
jgi:DNA-binding LytR/AlgR family response regulator